jgi:hypothetical protein
MVTATPSGLIWKPVTRPMFTPRIWTGSPARIPPACSMTVVA